MPDLGSARLGAVTAGPVDILLLDDSEDDRELMKRALRRPGRVWHVRVALSEAAFVEELSVAPDLILADYRMPGLGAMKALDILRDRGHNIPLIVVTGAIGDTAAVETIQAGAWDYVLKDNLEHLPVVVDHVLAQRALLREKQHVEERFQTLVENLPTIVYTAECGDERRWRFVSTKVFDILGFGAEEWTEDGLWVNQLHPEDRERVLAQDQECRASGSDFFSEYRLFASDGRVVWVQDHATVLKGNGEEALHRQGFMQDVTRSKEAEMLAAARIQQQSALARFGNLALTEPDIDNLGREACALIARTLAVPFAKVLELQPDGSFLVKAGVGWPEGVVGSTVAGDPTDAGFVLHHGEALLVDDLRMETRLEGSRLLEAHGAVSGISVLIGSGEEAYGVLSIHSDQPAAFSSEGVDFVQAVANVIAGAVHTESSLNRIRFRNSLLDRVDAAVAAMSADGVVTYWNKGAQRLYGWSSDEATGRSAVDLLGIDDGGRVREIAERLVEGKTWEGEWSPRTREVIWSPSMARSRLLSTIPEPTQARSQSPSTSARGSAWRWRFATARRGHFVS